MTTRQLSRASWLALMATVLVAGAGVVSYRRGTTLAPPLAPSSVADGARCGLIATHRIRCVVLARAPLDQVWAIITDYPRFPELFRSPLFAFELSSHERRADGHWRLVGAVSGLTQRWPFEIETTHVRSAERSTATWEQLSGVLATDRGGWTLEARSPGETSISYEIEVVLRGAPSFIVNNVLLDTLPGGIAQLANAASQGAP